MKHARQHNSGFTLVDVLLATAMIMILITITYPYVESYLNAEKERKEINTQLKISKALAAMAEYEGSVPSTTSMATVATALAKYTNLSENEIRYDSWRQAGDIATASERYYRTLQVQRAYRDVVLTINYVVVLSLGEGGCLGVDGAEDCTPLAVSNYVNGMLTSEADFYSLEAREGDVLTKYTDVDLRTDQYEETRRRMESIADALTEYATSKRYEGIVRGDDPTSIYYPPSRTGYDPAIYPMSTTDSNNISTELGGNVVRNNGSVSERYGDMRGLMRIIGLPEEYCCTPLFKESIGGELKERPFYYYTNARIRLATGACSPAYASTGDRKLPAKITVVADTCG